MIQRTHFLSARLFAVRALAAIALLLALAFAAPARATDIQPVVSPGGIELWLVHDSTVPLVSMEYAFVGGSSQDPAGKGGLANMVSGLLDEGAGELDSAAFQDRVEDLALELRFSADRDYFRGSLRTLTERIEPSFDLLRLALNEPRFDAPAVERIRGQIAVELRRESTDPTQMASHAWWANAFPDHPYGRPTKGTMASLAAISADDLKAYVRRLFARDNLKIAIVGDIEPEAAGRLVDKVFGSLPAKAELTPVPDKEPEGLGKRIVIDLNVPQAVVAFGGAGPRRKDPDFVTAFVVNHILGGGSFTSRLYQEVREKRGLAYGVSTYLFPMRDAALYMGWTQVRSDRTGDAIKLIEDETKRMGEEGPTAEELDRAKSYLTGSYALRFDTSTKIAGQLVQIQLEDLGIDYINQRNAQIEAVTLMDAKRVAKILLDKRFLETIVGRPKDLTGQPG